MPWPPRVFSDPSIFGQGATPHTLRQPGGSFTPHSQRWATFTATLDSSKAESMGDDMERILHERLVVRMGEAALDVVKRAAAKLKEKPDDVVTPDGHIYGLDTGKMHDTLTAQLVAAYADSLDKVYYDLLSPQADYWVWVEFGHMLRNGAWWPGYHFLGQALQESEAHIRQKVRQAWSDTVIIMASRASLAGGPVSL